MKKVSQIFYPNLIKCKNSHQNVCQYLKIFRERKFSSKQNFNKIFQNISKSAKKFDNISKFGKLFTKMFFNI